MRSKWLSFWDYFNFTISVILIVYLSVYLNGCKRYVLIQDTSWDTSVMQRNKWRLKYDFFCNGVRYKVKTIPASDAFSKDSALIDALSACSESDKVLLSPSIAVCCEILNVNPKEILADVEVVSIGYGKENDYYDGVLISDSSSAWDAAREDVDFLNSYFDTDYAYLCTSPESVRSYMNVQQLNSKLVVDYRFSETIPKSNLLGVVMPDFKSAFEESFKSGILKYEYRRIK